MQKSFETDIVIVNWNSGRYLAECIYSIKEFETGEKNNVVIVDNSSTDGSAAIDQSALNISILAMHKNLGFGKACNVGARQGAAPYILFLNPDARLMANTLKKALAFMGSEHGTRIGICGVRLVDEYGVTQRHCANFPKVRTYLGKALGLEGKFPTIFPFHLMRDFNHLTSRTVDQVIGAFFLVRREAFEALGGFDERFFVYLEEVDFSLRAKHAGWGTWYLAEATAFHKGGGSSEKVKASRLFYSIHSRMLYALKHFTRPQAFAVIFLALCIEPISRLVRALLHRSLQEAGDTLRGYAMVWKSVPSLLRGSGRHNIG